VQAVATTAAPPPPGAANSHPPSTITAEEAANIRKWLEVQRQNALRPFFDPDAFRLFILGFAISIISSALDLLAHGPLSDFFEVTH
jgi:hypothetical protein